LNSFAFNITNVREYGHGHIGAGVIGRVAFRKKETDVKHLKYIERYEGSCFRARLIKEMK
jgi:hypothetical protein